MTNDCIRIGMEFESQSIDSKTPSMKKLSLLSYGELSERYGGYSQYRLCAISKAAGILSSRRKSIRRRYRTRTPYLSRPVLVSCYGFKVENGNLVVHLGPDTFESIPLNAHTLRVISDPSVKVRSFSLSSRSLSLCVSKEVRQRDAHELAGAVGIDRNLRNLTVGDHERVTYYDMTEIVKIAENTNSIVSSFRRDDVRIGRSIASKYGERRRERVSRIVHLISKDIVRNARLNRKAIVFEEIRGIRKLYRKGNGQGRRFRGMMNFWPFHEVKRQVEYKAAWEGVPVINLSRGETQGATMDCPRCGERLQVPVRGDKVHRRQLWCEVCKRWTDRDLCAVLNISRRGWVRFAQSKGGAGEAVRGNPEHEGEPAILRVDASKLRHAHQTR